MVYLPPQLKNKIENLAKSQGTSQADVIRGAIEEGLGTVKFQDNTSAQGLVKLAQLGEKLQIKGPSDLSENLDKYLWDDYGK